MNLQSGRGCGILGVAKLHEGAEQLCLLSGRLGVGLGEERLATVDVASWISRDAGQDRLEPRVEPDVSGDVVSHDAGLQDLRAVSLVAGRTAASGQVQASGRLPGQ